MTFEKSFSIINYALDTAPISKTNSEKYSRGRRGAPAKGVGRATGARVQIPLSPLFKGKNKIKSSKNFKKIVDKRLRV